MKQSYIEKSGMFGSWSMGSWYRIVVVHRSVHIESTDARTATAPFRFLVEVNIR